MLPIKVNASKDFIQEFMACEEASYQDALNTNQADNHTYEVLQRHKTVIEIRNEHELEDVYYRLGSGLISSTDSDRCRIKQARRVQNELKPAMSAVDPTHCRMWDINRNLFF